MLLSTAISLVPDGTVVIQLAVFVGALGILTVWILRPLVRVRDLRRAATVETEAQAKALEETTARRLQEYEERIAAARQEGLVLKEQLRQEGYAKAREVIDEARRVSMARLDAAKGKIAAEATTARRLLESNAEEFGRLITERLLERALTEAPSRAASVRAASQREP